MLEVCPLIAVDKPTLEVHFLGIGIRKEQTARLVFTSKTGKGIKATVVDLGNRFPNLFGKWCRPNYNSAVATFCHNIANDLPITVNDPKTELELLYIDDLVEEMLSVLEGQPHRCDYDGLTPLLREDGQYCIVPVTHRATLGEIVDLLKSFRSQPETLLLPCIQEGSFAKKLLSISALHVALFFFANLLRPVKRQVPLC